MSVLISRDPVELQAAKARGIAGELLADGDLSGAARALAARLRDRAVGQP
jgi:hypothetical protein